MQDQPAAGTQGRRRGGWGASCLQLSERPGHCLVPAILFSLRVLSHRPRPHLRQQRVAVANTGRQQISGVDEAHTGHHAGGPGSIRMARRRSDRHTHTDSLHAHRRSHSFTHFDPNRHTDRRAHPCVIFERQMCASHSQARAQTHSHAVDSARSWGCSTMPALAHSSTGWTVCIRAWSLVSCRMRRHTRGRAEPEVGCALPCPTGGRAPVGLP